MPTRCRERLLPIVFALLLSVGILGSHSEALARGLEGKAVLLEGKEKLKVKGLGKDKDPWSAVACFFEDGSFFAVDDEGGSFIGTFEETKRRKYAFDLSPDSVAAAAAGLESYAEDLLAEQGVSDEVTVTLDKVKLKGKRKGSRLKFKARFKGEGRSQSDPTPQKGSYKVKAKGRLLDGSAVCNPPDPPDNDDLADARALVGENATDSGDNTAATFELDEPLHAGSTAGGSIWWTWTAPATGLVEISTAGSHFDTVLAVYTGTGMASLTPVVSNDDADPGSVLTSLVQFQAIAGTTYRIAVDSFDDAERGQVEIELSTPEPE